MATILVADNDLGLGEMVSLILEKAGHNCLIAQTAQDVFTHLRHEAVDLFILDWLWYNDWLQRRQDELTQVKGILHDIGVIMCISMLNPTHLTTPFPSFIDQIVPKPVQLNTFQENVANTLKKYGKTVPN